MDLLMTFLEFTAHWLIFAFSLYQSVLRLSASESDISVAVAKEIARYGGPKRWMLPFLPLWLRNEKRMLEKNGITFDNDAELYNLFGNVTAWYFISLAGWINMIVALYTLLKDLDRQWVTWLGIIIFAALATYLAILNTKFRLSPGQRDLLRRRFHPPQ